MAAGQMAWRKLNRMKEAYWFTLDKNNSYC
jgi:hypothetical protein